MLRTMRDLKDTPSAYQSDRLSARPSVPGRTYPSVYSSQGTVTRGGAAESGHWNTLSCGDTYTKGSE